MRGKRASVKRHVDVFRLIPAYAGKTSFEPPTYSQPRAHPRVCGENHRRPRGIAGTRGSSPRMRGKRRRLIAVRNDPGLIPAYAGKTRSAGPGTSRPPAHPRVCGENFDMVILDESSSGSSPRMRGKPGGVILQVLIIGLIPAYAGKTQRARERRAQSWAHPRVCGENWPKRSIKPRPFGSSPRMRGKPERGAQSLRSHRLIPAYAGKTCEPGPRRQRRPAHPRVCGENSNLGAVSSIQPAHPRVCGENSLLS